MIGRSRPCSLLVLAAGMAGCGDAVSPDTAVDTAVDTASDSGDTGRTDDTGPRAECLSVIATYEPSAGVPAGLETFTYDEHGRPLTDTYVGEMYNGENYFDGDWEHTYAYTDDAEGNIVRVEGVYLEHGYWVPESTYAYVATYDDAGRQVEYVQDDDNDGTVDWTREYTYDERGNVTTSTRVYPDGTVADVQTWAYTYDADDNVIEVTASRDGVADYTASYTHDARGNVLTVAYDHDNDGEVDSVSIYAYDANDNCLSMSKDSDNDGIPDLLYTYTYDEDNHQVGFTYDHGADGTLDTIGVSRQDDHGSPTASETMSSTGSLTLDLYTPVYDDNDHLASITWWRHPSSVEATTTYAYGPVGEHLSTAVDWGSDSVQEYGYTYTYDANGYLASDSYTLSLFGTLRSSQSYRRDPDGRVLVQERDDDGDGTADTRAAYAYDDRGNPVRVAYDTGADGLLDRVDTWAYTYDASDNVLSLAFLSTAESPYGETYTYDAAGRRLTAARDEGDDGTVDDTWTYAYDATGNLVVFTYDWDGDGAADSVTTYAYDAANNLLSTTADTDADGVADSVTTYTYDAANNLTTVARDSGADGDVESRRAYTYDADNRVLSDSADSDGDGTLDERTTYTYVVDGC